MTCNLDNKYGYSKERSEAQRDALLNTAAMLIPVGTGFAMARYGATALFAGKGFRIGSMMLSGALTAVGSRDALIRSCAEFSRDVKISDCNEQNVMSFALNNIEKQSCLLEATLAGTQGVAALVPEFMLLRKNAAVAKSITEVTEQRAVVSRASSLKAGSKDGLQEKIWELRKAGNTSQASQLEAEVVETLKSGKVVSREKIGVGINQAEMLTFSDGTQGVWKRTTAMTSNADAEVAATIVDRHLGTNMVPVTVYREVDGVKGSVQLKVGNLKDGSKFVDDPESMNLFDSLIGNIDRHGGNYLMTEKGQIVAIDNGLSFRGCSLWGIKKIEKKFQSPGLEGFS